MLSVNKNIKNSDSLSKLFSWTPLQITFCNVRRRCLNISKKIHYTYITKKKLIFFSSLLVNNIYLYRINFKKLNGSFFSLFFLDVKINFFFLCNLWKLRLWNLMQDYYYNEFCTYFCSDFRFLYFLQRKYYMLNIFSLS